MLSRGTTTRSAEDISEELVRIAGELGVNADQDKLSVSLKIPAAHFAAGLDIFSDIILHPDFSEDELDKRKEDHLAAMPYEIILENNMATMLHGRYRLALHWPELTMGTFMKIRSAPGDIEDALESLCE